MFLCFYFIAEKLVKQYENKDNKENRNDVINNDNLKNNTVTIIGDKKKCCIN